MREERHYYAFISHSTKDEKIATWLRERLVNYNIPVSVQKEYNAPKRLRPIFLYQTDLAGNVLNESLRTELQDSHYLIVICSPAGAQSGYVNREVKHFIETGRAEYIIPVIVEGTPHASDPSEECFPPALLELAGENELRGVDLKAAKTKYGSKQGVVANIVASMLGVRFDILWDLYKRKRKRKMLLWSLMLFILMLGVLFVWDYKRPTYKYFVDYVDCWGVPEGIMPIDKKDVSHRGASYRFEYHRVPFGTENAYSWRVTKVCYVNSSMRLQQNVPEVEMRTRYPMVEVEYYKKTNVVSRLNFYDKSGKIQLRHNLTARDGQPALIADFVSSKEENGVGFENAELTAMMEKPLYEIPRKSNIVRYVYERDQSGHIIRQTFHHNNDYDLSKSIQCDAMGVFGKQYVLDSLGRPQKILYLDENGNNCPSKSGVCGLCYEYDKNGSVSEIIFIDSSGKPTINEQHFAIVRQAFDKYGNCIEESYYDSENKKCLNAKGVHKYVYQVDDGGYPIKQSCYGVNNQSCYNNDNVSVIAVKYDKQGNRIELSGYDSEGQPCFCKDGFFTMKMKYDRNGNCVERCTYGTDGKLCYGNNNFAIERDRFDKNGNIIEITIYGVDGNLCLSKKDGIAGVELKYDEEGNRIETSFFDTKKQPCYNNSGISKTKWTYERGNVTGIFFYDVKGKPCFCKDGYASCRGKVDENGNLVDVVIEGTDDMPVNSDWVRVTQVYDQRGNLIERRFYDEEGDLCMTKEGVAVIKAKYDDKGNILEEIFFGEDELPCMNNVYVAKVTHQYDNKGNEVEECYYGTDDKPCLCVANFSKWTAEYDMFGRVICKSFYDVDGKPCEHLDGGVETRREYDERGNITKQSFYGKDGQLCDNVLGYSVLVTKYDDCNREIEACSYGTDLKPCMGKGGYAKIKVDYDERGNMVGMSCYDEQGMACVNRDGYAQERLLFDEKNNIRECLFLDTCGKLCVNNNGFAKVVNIFDECGNLRELQYYGKDNEKIDLNGMVHKMVMEYNERWDLEKVSLYNSKNMLINVVPGTVLKSSGMDMEYQMKNGFGSHL